MKEIMLMIKNPASQSSFNCNLAFKRGDKI
jgi:hypothetical protein